MQKQEITIKDPSMTYWLWDMPEIQNEIPELFVEAGTAEVKRQTLNGVLIELHLKNPAVVIRAPRNSQKGIVFNRDTRACINAKMRLLVTKLPTNGDSVIVFNLDLQLETYDKEVELTLDTMRQAIRDVARAMTETWHLI